MDLNIFSEEIKDRTLTDHRQLEKHLVGIMKGMRSKSDYIKLLKLFYGFFGGLEDQIGKYIGTQQVPDLEIRRNAEKLRQDIIAMGAEAGDKAAGDDLPAISNEAQAFGAMYVMEGSTLGGQYIVQMIAGPLQLDPAIGFSFFSGYGDDTKAMWARFQEILNAEAREGEKGETMIKAANETFMKFKNWAEKNG